MKVRESHESDLKPDDLSMSKAKSSERRMEVWTVAIYMCSNDLWIGVKSLSNLAMAGSYWNMPSYSLVMSVSEVKYGWKLQGLLITDFFPTQNLLTTCNRNQGWCVRYHSETQTRETKVKVPKFMLSVSNGVLNQRHWGCKPRSSYHLKKA